MKITIYGANWCSDCINVKEFLKSKGIMFEEIDISNNVQATKFVEKVNNGKRVVPTIDVDGKVYANPGISKLTKVIKE